MTFYILFFLCISGLLLLDREERYKNFNIKFLVFLLIFIVAAIRFDVGWDYVSYFDLIEKNHKFYSAQIERLEPFNQGIIFLSQFVGFTQLYFITTSFIIYFSFYNTFKKYSADFAISILLFLALPIFFFNSLSIIRQFVAIAIVLYGIPYIISKKIFRFYFILVIAILFHKSAIIAVPLYFLYDRKVHFYFYPIIFVLGFFSSDLLYWLVEHLQPQYLKFLDRSIGKGGNMVLLLFQIMGFVLLFFTNRMNRNKKINSFYFLAYFVGLFIWSSLAKYGHAGFRGSLYYTVFSLLLIPNILIEIKQKAIIKEATYVFCLGFFVLSLYLGKTNPKKDPNMPYKTFFFKNRVDIQESTK